MRLVRLLGHGATAILVCATASAAGAADQPPFRGSLEVTRILSDVRVVRGDGTPVTGLGPADFIVTVDGEPATVESADWRPGSTAGDGAAPGSDTGASVPRITPLEPPSGRLIVVLIQTDIAFYRIDGLYRIDDTAMDFLRTLRPSDRVAVAVFGSHLELHADFTNDFEALCRELTAPAAVRSRRVVDDGRSPSLARHLDAERARRATNLSQALAVVGDALAPIDGAKSVVVLGWGIGRYHASQGVVHLGPDYPRALAALAAARAAVFSLDITSADYHSLEVGLERVADDTGGFYAKTHLFPELALAKLARALDGRYELAIVPPGPLDEEFEVDVRVALADTEVLARKVHYRLSASRSAGDAPMQPLDAESESGRGSRE